MQVHHDFSVLNFQNQSDESRLLNYCLFMFFISVDKGILLNKVFFYQQIYMNKKNQIGNNRNERK